MRSETTDAVLLQMLRDEGVDPSALRADDIRKVWEVFKRLGATPTEDVDPDPWANDDGLLVQYGVYDRGRRKHFELDFTRQFSYYDERGEYSGMTQLNCTFLFEPTPELRTIPAENLWSFDMPLESFFVTAEGLVGLDRVLELEPRPLRLDIELHPV